MLNSYYQDRLVFKTQKIVSIDDGLRGNIYDKNGILLVGNKKVYNLTYHYNENEDILEILKFLYNNFNINKDEFLKKVNNSYKYEDIILKDNLDEKKISLVLNSGVKGLFIKESFERFYPYKDTLKNVLGSVGPIQKENKNYYLKKGYKLYEKVGISGLEREYEEYLKGTNAKYKVNNDNSLTLVSEGKKGSNLYLSIDINLVNEINKAKEETKSFLIQNDFDYLVRGGRLSSIVGKIGSVIKLVPVMTLSEDKKSLVKLFYLPALSIRHSISALYFNKRNR